MEKPNENWKNVRVYIGGKEITEIKSLEYKHSTPLPVLERALREAEEREEYELCAEIKKQIDEFKKQ